MFTLQPPLVLPPTASCATPPRSPSSLPMCCSSTAAMIDAAMWPKSPTSDWRSSAPGDIYPTRRGARYAACICVSTPHWYCVCICVVRLIICSAVATLADKKATQCTCEPYMLSVRGVRELHRVFHKLLLKLSNLHGTCMPERVCVCVRPECVCVCTFLYGSWFTWRRSDCFKDSSSQPLTCSASESCCGRYVSWVACRTLDRTMLLYSPYALVQLHNLVAGPEGMNINDLYRGSGRTEQAHRVMSR